MLVTVTKSENGAAGARLEVLLSHCRGRAIAKESILLVELLPLLAAASTESLGRLGLQSAGRKTLPTFGYVAYNQNNCLI